MNVRQYVSSEVCFYWILQHLSSPFCYTLTTFPPFPRCRLMSVVLDDGSSCVPFLSSSSQNSLPCWSLWISFFISRVIIISPFLTWQEDILPTRNRCNPELKGSLWVWSKTFLFLIEHWSLQSKRRHCIDGGEEFSLLLFVFLSRRQPDLGRMTYQWVILSASSSLSLSRTSDSLGWKQKGNWEVKVRLSSNDSSLFLFFRVEYSSLSPSISLFSFPSPRQGWDWLFHGNGMVRNLQPTPRRESSRHNLTQTEVRKKTKGETKRNDCLYTTTKTTKRESVKHRQTGWKRKILEL